MWREGTLYKSGTPRTEEIRGPFRLVQGSPRTPFSLLLSWQTLYPQGTSPGVGRDGIRDVPVDEGGRSHISSSTSYQSRVFVSRSGHTTCPEFDFHRIY